MAWIDSGESEKAIRDLFQMAANSTPAILFLDNFDILSNKRHFNSQDTGVDERVLSTLLNEMDGISGKDDGIIVIGATS